MNDNDKLQEHMKAIEPDWEEMGRSERGSHIDRIPNRALTCSTRHVCSTNKMVETKVKRGTEEQVCKTCGFRFTFDWSYK